MSQASTEKWEAYRETLVQSATDRVLEGVADTLLAVREQIDAMVRDLGGHALDPQFIDGAVRQNAAGLGEMLLDAIRDDLPITPRFAIGECDWCELVVDDEALIDIVRGLVITRLLQVGRKHG